MPLSKDKSEKSFKKNVKTEYEEGKPLKQSLAIAYAMKRKAKKYAEGGQITDNYESPCTEHCVHPCQVHPQNSGFQEHEGDVKRPNGSAGSEDERKLNQHGAEEVGREGHEGHYAEGGELRGVHEAEGESEESRGVSKAGEHSRLDDHEEAKKEHYRILGELKADRRDRKFMASGGDVEPPEGTYEKDHTYRVDPEEMAGSYSSGQGTEKEEDRHDQEGQPMAEGGQITDNYADTEDGDGRDMVGRIMKQRAQEYSEGGKVANSSEANRDTDYLADSDDLSFEYTGANSGDERDSSAENKRRSDIVSRIMNSRKKKDKLPNPR